MHNQFDATWLLRYCAGTYARFIAEGSNALKSVYWGFGGRIDWRLKCLIFRDQTFGPRPFGTAGTWSSGSPSPSYLLSEQRERTLSRHTRPRSAKYGQSNRCAEVDWMRSADCALKFDQGERRVFDPLVASFPSTVYQYYQKAMRFGAWAFRFWPVSRQDA